LKAFAKPEGAHGCISPPSEVIFEHQEGEGEGRAGSLQGREGNVIAGVDACAVGAMTLLL